MTCHRERDEDAQVWLVWGLQNHIQSLLATRTHKICQILQHQFCSSVSILSLEWCRMPFVDFLFALFNRKISSITLILSHSTKNCIPCSSSAAICKFPCVNDSPSYKAPWLGTSTCRDAGLYPPASDSIEEEPEEASIRGLRQFWVLFLAGILWKSSGMCLVGYVEKWRQVD